MWDHALRPNSGGAKAAIFLARQLLWPGQDELEEGNSAVRETREPDESLAVLSVEERCALNEILKKLYDA